MTNKQLIDHCNAFWGKKGRCADCPDPYNHIYCAAFCAKFGTTPFMENTRHEEYYTDEEIEYENCAGNQKQNP